MAASSDGKQPGIASEQVELAAVYGPENEPWSKFTPSGGVTLHISNPDAMGKFVPGKHYFIDIAPVE